MLVAGLVVATAFMLYALTRQGERRREGEQAELEPWQRVRQAAVSAQGPAHEGRQREAVCEAALGVTEADMAQVWELDDDGELVVTESSGAPPRSARVRLAPGAGEHLRDDRPRSHDELVSAAHGPLLAATGATRLHVEPMVVGGRFAGYLAAGWSSYAAEPTDDVRSVLALLATHAAMIAERGELQRSARTDPLTGLPNRRAFDDVLRREMNRATRLHTPLTVALLDLDGFKQLNDTLGHQAGDEALRAAGESWSVQLRNMDVIARYGGDEFVVLLPTCGLSEAREVLDRMRTATPLGLGCSIGLTTWVSGERPDELVARADTALYASKRTGRDRTTALEPDRDGGHGARLHPPAVAG